MILTPIKQPNTWTCSAACACMIAGQPIESFYDFVGHDGSGIDPESQHPEKRRGFSYREVIKYLAHHDIVLGSGFTVAFDPDTSRTWGCVVRIDPEEWPMLLGVKSERFEGAEHVIYWDAKQVWDPNPDTEDGRPLTSYQVIDAWLIHLPETV